MIKTGNDFMDMFWYRHRLLRGYDPNEPLSFEEIRHFNKIKRQRQKCLESDSPHYAITKAVYFDKQYFLEKWWNELTAFDKEYYLKHVWANKADGNFYGFDWWLPYFKEVGFFSNIDIERPKEPITLYRGIEPHFKRGMSWTPTYEMALSFSKTVSLWEGGKKVFKTIVQPESVLAILKGNGIESDGTVWYEGGLEYIINHQELGEITTVD